MAQIRLTGKHAVGEHQFALVDDDLFEELNRYKWKAKPNGSGSHVYAVRNALNEDGTHATLRMHRVVLGYSGDLDVDHINHNALDNRRANLRIVTRSLNGRNRRTFQLSGVCCDCGGSFETSNRSNIVPERCVSCQVEAGVYAPHSFVSFLVCCCGKPFVGRTPTAAHCSNRCKERENQRAKRERRKQATGFSLSPEQLLRNRERCRIWRLQRKTA